MEGGRAVYAFSTGVDQDGGGSVEGHVGLGVEGGGAGLYGGAYPADGSVISRTPLRLDVLKQS